MGRWQIYSGPRRYSRRLSGGAEPPEIDVGWTFDLKRGNEQRVMRVEVAKGTETRPSLPDDSRDAIATRGTSAVKSMLDRDEPPILLLVTAEGVVEQEN